jgi:hypothetical protein
MGDYTIEGDRHIAVGPNPDLYGHGPATVIGRHDDADDTPIWICLDCGYTAGDPRLFAHVECDPDENPLSAWRERIDNDGFPEPE